MYNKQSVGLAGAGPAWTPALVRATQPDETETQHKKERMVIDSALPRGLL